MAEVRGLPFGRPPTQQARAGFLEERRRSVDDTRPGWICVGGSPYAFVDSSAVGVINTLHLQQIGDLTRDISIDQAVLRVTGASAGAHARSGVYIYDISTREFRLIPRTETSFDLTSATILELNLKEATTLLAKGYYFIGFSADSVVPTFSASAGTGSFAHYEISHASGALPSSVRKLHTTRAYSPRFGVVYQAAAIGGAPEL